VSHYRTVIRDAAVRALIDAGTNAHGRVYDHPWNDRDTLPAIVVEDLGETQAATTYGQGAARGVERVLLLEISGELQPLERMAPARDELMSQIETAIAELVVPGVKVIVPAGYQADESNNGGRQVVVGRQRFEVTYITPMNNPAAVL
jgi:hypothetical protein